MAAQVRLIRLAWENGVNFKMDSKLDDGDFVTIIDVDENGHLDKLWDSGIATVCTTYFETELGIIGSEMKA
jgi:hypothetical protein